MNVAYVYFHANPNRSLTAFTEEKDYSALVLIKETAEVYNSTLLVTTTWSSV